MKVHELIAELQKLDPEARILVQVYELGFDDPGIIQKVKATLHPRPEDWVGRYLSLQEAKEAISSKMLLLRDPPSETLPSMDQLKNQAFPAYVLMRPGR